MRYYFSMRLHVDDSINYIYIFFTFYKCSFMISAIDLSISLGMAPLSWRV